MKQLSLGLLIVLSSISFSFGQLRTKSEVQKMLVNSTSNSAKSFLADSLEYIVKDGHTEEGLNIEHVYLQQTYKSIKVYNVVKSMAFRNNILQYSSGKFLTDIAAKAPSSTPSISASDAVTLAAVSLGLNKPTNLSIVTNTFNTDNKIVYSNGGIAKSNINTELVWVSNDDGKTIHLAWNVEIEPTIGRDYWHLRVDAANGSIVNKGNYTVYEKHNTFAPRKSTFISKPQQCDDISNVTPSMWATSNTSNNLSKVLMAPAPPPTVTTATYNVIPYPAESPFVAGPTVVTDPWNTNLPVGNNATTYGWHYDGKTNYTKSFGNNIHTYDDSLNKNAPGRPDTSTTPIPTLTFNFTPDFTLQPTNTTNRQFAEANLFYWNNLMHDMSYQYGFTEAAGNFQNTNTINGVNRGGKAGDPVLTEAQDGSGTDNSNMSALPDGQTGRQQMYLFTSVKPSTNSFITIPTPSTIAGNYTYTEGNMSTANKLATVGSVTGQFVLYEDDASNLNHRACTGAPKVSVKGNIAVIYRGGCTFVIKVKNAQTAGATAVIMIDTVIGGPPIIMSGSDNTITIPAVLVNDSIGAMLQAQFDQSNTVTGTINASIPAPEFDGDLDNSVVTHEFTHGISLRLTGGPATTSCLDNAEEAGEGWSDYVALNMVTDWTKAQLTDGTLPRTIGSYVISQTPGVTVGVRTVPYCTDMSVDPHTYADLADPNYNGEVHYIGEVWCSTLWDLTWGLIQQVGFINPNLFDTTLKGGNTIAMQLMVEGLKLQPCSPGFLDGRDAILAADSILYNGAHKCTIWNVFAARGMGYSASEGSSNVCGDETAAFDVPPCILPVSLTAFTATPVINKVVLKWNTTAEINTSGYDVEYSTNATNWTSIGFVNARNTGGSNDYSTTHYQPVTGANYYRLKMLDKDGSYKYSKTLLVNFTGKTGLVVYPNPVKDVLTAEVYKSQVEKLNIKIIDVAGRVIHSENVQSQIGDNLFQLNTNTLSKGTYFIVVEGATKEVKQFVKD